MTTTSTKYLSCIYIQDLLSRLPALSLSVHPQFPNLCLLLAAAVSVTRIQFIHSLLAWRKCVDNRFLKYWGSIDTGQLFLS